MELSERQERILQYIRQYLVENRYPPTIREIGRAVGITSTSVVKYNLERLQGKGLLERNEDVSRGLRLKPDPLGSDLTGLPSRIVEVPKYGIISAGLPIAAAGQQDNPFAGETLTLTRDLVSSDAGIYALQVKGDSMIDALVYDGDWVVIRHDTAPHPRDMIVAWLKDREETTLKYYFPEGRTVRLQPANPAYLPITVEADQLVIQGKVIAVVRQLA
jgi:repressor LexA